MGQTGEVTAASISQPATLSTVQVPPLTRTRIFANLSVPELRQIKEKKDLDQLEGSDSDSAGDFFRSSPMEAARSPQERSPDYAGDDDDAVDDVTLEAEAEAGGGDLVARRPNAMTLYSSLGGELRRLIRQVEGYDATIDMLLAKNARLQNRLQSRGRGTETTGVSNGNTATRHADREVNEEAVAEVDRLRRDLQRARNDVAVLRGEVTMLRAENGNLRDKNDSLRSSSSLRVEELTRRVAEKNELLRQLEATRNDHKALREKHDWVCKEHEALLDEFRALQVRADAQSREGSRSESHPMQVEAPTSGAHWPSHSGSAPGKSDSTDVGSGTPSDSADDACESRDDSPRSVVPDGLSAADVCPVAQSYLDEPVTEALDKVMRKGVAAFMSFRDNGSHKSTLSSGDERVYYVCQACTRCRSNPGRAVYFSYSFMAYPTHPLHCPGFASYEVPLPNQAKGQFRRHLREMRMKPGVVVADVPAAEARSYT